MWQDPALYSFVGLGICTFLLSNIMPYCSEAENGWSVFFSIPLWLVHVAFLAIFASFVVSSYLTYRVIVKYQRRRPSDESGWSVNDTSRFIAIYAINLFMIWMWSLFFFRMKHKALGIVCTIILAISLGYQTGLTAKWGEKLGGGTLKGSVWMIFPIFFTVIMSAIVLVMAIDLKNGKHKWM